MKTVIQDMEVAMLDFQIHSDDIDNFSIDVSGQMIQNNKTKIS